MQIEFDPDKDAANRDKHGVSLGEAERLDWDTAAIWPDERFDYGEARMRGLGYVGARLHYVAFVDRESARGRNGESQTIRRIISLRKANKREYRDYASA